MLFMGVYISPWSVIEKSGSVFRQNWIVYYGRLNWVENDRQISTSSNQYATEIGGSAFVFQYRTWKIV